MCQWFSAVCGLVQCAYLSVVKCSVLICQWFSAVCGLVQCADVSVVQCSVWFRAVCWYVSGLVQCALFSDRYDHIRAPSRGEGSSSEQQNRSSSAGASAPGPRPLPDTSKHASKPLVLRDKGVRYTAWLYITATVLSWLWTDAVLLCFSAGLWQQSEGLLGLQQRQQASLLSGGDPQRSAEWGQRRRRAASRPPAALPLPSDGTLSLRGQLPISSWRSVWNMPPAGSASKRPWTKSSAWEGDWVLFFL